jgi:hypothetical protein
MSFKPIPTFDTLLTFHKTVSGGSKDASKEGSSMLGQAQDGLNNAAKSASDALGLGEKK